MRLLYQNLPEFILCASVRVISSLDIIFPCLVSNTIGIFNPLQKKKKKDTQVRTLTARQNKTHNKKQNHYYNYTGSGGERKKNK